MKLIRLIKLCLNTNFSRVRVGKHLSDMFPINKSLKQGDALLPLLFIIAVEYAITKVQVNQVYTGCWHGDLRYFFFYC
jgi:hypothetical protein